VVLKIKFKTFLVNIFKGMSEKENDIVQKTLISVFGFIVAYFIFGIYFNSQINIYPSFPNEFDYTPFDPVEGLSYHVHNQAPLTIPWFNPQYTVKVIISSDNENVYAQFRTIRGFINTTDTFLSLGTINPGDSKEFYLSLNLDEEDINIDIEINLLLLNNIKIQVKNIRTSLEYQGNYRFKVR